MQLNKLYDKKYIISIYEVLYHIGQKENNKYYDPAFDTFTTIDKKKLFLECWREYFRILMPIYVKKNAKINKKQSLELIHLIFGNEVSQMTRILYSNALFFRVGIKTLYSNIEKYKTYEQKQ